MRLSPRTIRGLAIGTLALGAALALVGVAGSSSSTSTAASPATNPVERDTTEHSIDASTTSTTSTTTPVAVLPARAFDSGNGQLDALLSTLPAVLLEGDAQVHFGYNPIDCCHAGGYNPDPNEVWVGETAFASASSLTYVTAHELAHSVHLRSSRAAALTAAVAGAPVVRAGSPWDESEKVADCVAWVLYPAETAASGLTYWDCPDPYRTQVAAALQ